MFENPQNGAKIPMINIYEIFANVCDDIKIKGGFAMC